MIKTLLYISICFLFVLPALAVDIRGPGHEDRPGFGTTARGPWAAANDPDICIVTSRNWTSGSPGTDTRTGVSVKTGTFRQCVDYNPGANKGKVILFEVNGTIDGNWDNLNIDYPNTAIYGQTAPSPGVQFKKLTLNIVNSDILIQHIRVRTGGNAPSGCNNNDCISAGCLPGETFENIVIDHVSMAWSTDEITDIYCYGTGGTITDVTLSYSIAGEALEDNCHTDGDGNPELHSLGIMTSMSNGATQEVSNVSFIGNLEIHVAGRVPLLRADTAWVNNITYNPQWPPSNDINFIYETEDASIVGNLYKKGPDSSANNYGVQLLGTWAGSPACAGSHVFVADNITKQCSSDYSIACPGWASVVTDSAGCKAIVEVESPPTWPTGLVADPATSVLGNLTATSGARSVGAWPAARDSVDQCLVNDLINGRGQIVDDEDEVGGCGGGVGWPTYTADTHTLSIPTSPHSVQTSGYTNLEEWIHENYTGSAEGRTINFPSTNTRPVIDAGPDQAIVLPANSVLDGTVTDDGLPNPPGLVTTSWTKQSGPGTVTFADADAVDTTASFSAAGTYILVLTADDSALQAHDEVTIIASSSPTPITYTVLRIASAPVPDGNIAEFGNADTIDLTGTNANGIYRLLYDDVALYIAAEVDDPDFNAIHSTRDANLYQDDSVELFFDTLHNGGGSMAADDYKFLVNLHNAQMDTQAYDISWNTSFGSAVSLNGTLNNDADTDITYVVEVAIPWSQWGISTPTRRTVFGFDLSLNDRDGSGSSEKTLWSNSDRGSSNNPDGWGDLQFSSTVVNPVDTTPPAAPSALIIVE